MKSFSELYARALERKGEDALHARFASIKTAAELASIGDDRYLSVMCQRVFAAGFAYRVVKAKWPGFEESFEGFNPDILNAMDTASAIDAYATDERIIRNRQKITAVFGNAAFVAEIAKEHGSFGAFVGNWPDSDITGLWDVLKARGKRLGGNTGPRVLRDMGKDTFILTNDVVQSFIDQGILDKKPTSKKAMKTVAATFNAWAKESGRPLSHISVVVACTVDRST